MESSPLRFLDLDVSLMLAGEVRNSQEEEARKFYEIEYYEEYNNLNHGNHNILSRVFNEIYCNIQNNLTIILRLRQARDYRWAHGKTWYELSIHERMCIFEKERFAEEEILKEEERLEEEDHYISDISWHNYLHMSKP